MPRTFPVGPLPQFKVAQLLDAPGVPIDMNMIANAYERDAMREFYRRQRASQMLGSMRGMKGSKTQAGLKGYSEFGRQLMGEIAERQQQLTEQIFSPEMEGNEAKQQQLLLEYDNWLQFHSGYQRELAAEAAADKALENYDSDPSKYSDLRLADIFERYHEATGPTNPNTFSTANFQAHDLSEYGKEFFGTGKIEEWTSTRNIMMVNPETGQQELATEKLITAHPIEFYDAAFKDWLSATHPDVFNWARYHYTDEEGEFSMDRFSQAVEDQVIKRYRPEAETPGYSGPELSVWGQEQTFSTKSGPKNSSSTPEVASTTGYRTLMPYTSAIFKPTKSGNYADTKQQIDELGVKLDQWSRGIDEHYAAGVISMDGYDPTTAKLTPSQYLAELYNQTKASGVIKHLHVVGPDGQPNSEYKNQIISDVHKYVREKREYKQMRAALGPIYAPAQAGTQSWIERNVEGYSMEDLGLSWETVDDVGMPVIELVHDPSVIENQKDTPISMPRQGFSYQSRGFGTQYDKADKVRQIKEQWEAQKQEHYTQAQDQLYEWQPKVVQYLSSIDEETTEDAIKDRTLENSIQRPFFNSNLTMTASAWGKEDQFLFDGNKFNFNQFEQLLKDKYKIDIGYILTPYPNIDRTVDKALQNELGDIAGVDWYWEFDGILPNSEDLQTYAVGHMELRAETTSDKVLKHFQTVEAEFNKEHGGGEQMVTASMPTDKQGKPLGYISLSFNFETFVPFTGWGEDWAADFAKGDQSTYIDMFTQFTDQIPANQVYEMPSWQGPAIQVVKGWNVENLAQYDISYVAPDGGKIEELSLDQEKANQFIADYMKGSLDIHSLDKADHTHIAFAPNFNYQELDMVTKAGLLNMQNYLANTFGMGMYLNSGARTPEYDKSVGGSGSGPHVPKLGRGALAVDMTFFQEGTEAASKYINNYIRDILWEAWNKDPTRSYYRSLLRQMTGTYNVHVLGPWNAADHQDHLHFRFE